MPRSTLGTERCGAYRTCLPFVRNTPRKKTLSLPPGFEDGEAVARYPLSRHPVGPPAPFRNNVLSRFLDVTFAFLPNEIIITLEEEVDVRPGRSCGIGGVIFADSVGGCR